MDHKTKEHPQFKQGYLCAVRLLTASKKSQREVKKRLLEKGYNSEVVDLVLETLTAQGLLNDRKMVQETVQWQKQAKRYGRRRIALELKKKGITENVITEALSEYSTADERETAYQLAESKWIKLERVDPLKRKKRLFDYLVARGFDFELTREIVNALNSKKNNEDF